MENNARINMRLFPRYSNEPGRERTMHLEIQDTTSGTLVASAYLTGDDLVHLFSGAQVGSADGIPGRITPPEARHRLGLHRVHAVCSVPTTMPTQWLRNYQVNWTHGEVWEQHIHDWAAWQTGEIGAETFSASRTNSGKTRLLFRNWLVTEDLAASWALLADGLLKQNPGPERYAPGAEFRNGPTPEVDTPSV